MKKLRILVLAAVVATSMMGVGYAAWTDGFQTTSTINTGELEVEISSFDSKIMVDYSTDTMRGLKDNLEVTPPSIDNEEQKITYAFKNLYPGTAAVTYLTAKNTGTMPAAIQRLTVTLRHNNKIIEAGTASELAKGMNVAYSFAVRDSDSKIVRGQKITGTCSFLELPEVMSKKLVGQYLLPNEELSTGDQAENSGYWLKYNILPTLVNDGELDGVSIDIDFDFVQHNLFTK
jgi:hypothetical protein